VPFDELVASLDLPRRADHHPVFQASFMLLNTPQGAVQLSGLGLSPHEVPVTAAEYELSLNLQERGDAIAGVLIYAADRFNPDTIAAWLEAFQVLLQAMLDDPASRVGELLTRDVAPRPRAPMHG
jgi:non-ribosomal peptide synthetase component F